MAIKLVKSIMLLGLPFYFLNMCIFLFVRITMQVKPVISIADLYQIEKLIINWLIVFLLIAIVSLVTVVYINRRMKLVENLDDFIRKEVVQRSQWLMLLCGTLIILELVEALSGNHSQQVDFLNGSWIAYLPKSGTKLVPEMVAYHLMWGHCRRLSVILICLSSIALFISLSSIKLLNRTNREIRNRQ